MRGTDAGEQRSHIVAELGMTLRVAGDALLGNAPVVPEMHVPGTRCVRTSVLATWADLVCGLLAGQHMGPRVPVTLDLTVDLYREAALDQINAIGRVVKSGRSVFVAAAEFTDDAGSPVATSTASFMAAPDASLRLPPLTESIRTNHSGSGRLLSEPFAQRAGCERRGVGVAALRRSEDGINSSGTINGGMLALVVEEAALSTGAGTTVASLAMRYLRPARVGPVVATADAHDGLARVEVRDEGSDDRVAVLATTRSFRPRP